MSGRIEAKIIIAHEGAASSGKSTQVARSKRRYAHDPTVLVREDVARKVLIRPEIRDKPVYTRAVQEQIQHQKIRELEEVSQPPHIKHGEFDGSVLSPSLLLEYFGNSEEAQQLYQQIAPLLSRYSLIFLHSPEGVPFENDGVRREKPEDRPKIHELYQTIFVAHNVPFKVVTGTKDEREQQIIEATEELHTPKYVIFEAENAPVT